MTDGKQPNNLTFREIKAVNKLCKNKMLEAKGTYNTMTIRPSQQDKQMCHFLYCWNSKIQSL